jgi:mono/diheme cytochrome c family protein
MILAVLFLGTGIYLIFEGPALSVLMYVKLGLVFASIPLAIIGFKKAKKPLAIIAILFLLAAYGLAEMSKAKYAKADKAPIKTDQANGDPLGVGQVVYIAKCTACHGAKGDAGLAGAKNLRITILTADQQKDIIKHGNNAGMSAFPELTDEQLNGLVAYIKTLK